MASEGGSPVALNAGASDPLLGRVIAGRFQILSLIARGGMGKVYKAEQAPLGRICAIKILNPNYTGDADPEFHRRFFREASITSRITHPNSVTIFDYGKTDDDVYYMAMEYLSGQTLHHTIRHVGPMPEERVGRISQQICRALREAHALGVIHRDLKPANIFLTRHGDDEDFVKVLDFGLVKHITELPEEQLTQTGLFMGSPKYMAPEQIQSGHVDARTDVYALGIMMYEMLAGKVPFERATSVNILMAHVGEPPPPMRQVNPDLVCSPAFEELVMRCIAKDPIDRFSTMDELLQAIKRAHGGLMTEQVASVNLTGVYQPIPTLPPPPVRPRIASAGASGNHTPMGVMQAIEVEISDSSDEQASSRRNKTWIAVAILAAAVLGGSLGLAAFLASNKPTLGRAVAAQPPAAPPAEATSEIPRTAPEPMPPPKTVSVEVVSVPPGATVRENTQELCAATPCQIQFTGADAEATKEHRLVIAKSGFRSETKVVRPGEAPLQVKLARSTQPRPAANASPNPSEATPNGFKEVPY